MVRPSNVLRRFVLSAGLGLFANASPVFAAELPSAATAAPIGALRAGLDVHRPVADGAATYALSLRPDALPAGAVTAHRHLVLVDTSASQVGAFRTQQLAVLDAFLKSLPPGDRVRLLAVDVQVEDLTEDFADPQGDAVRGARRTLDRRAPLGATDLQAGLARCLTLAGTEPADIVYLGDGMSTARLVQSGALRELCGELRGRHAAVHAFAVGPQTDLQLLGILALQTGGVVVADQAEDGIRKKAAPRTADEIGRSLAAAATRPVYHPRSVTVNESAGTLSPNVALPLRTDRETIYVGHGPLDRPVRIEVAGATDAGESTLVFAADPRQADRATPLLAAAWKQAGLDGGLSVPFAGRGVYLAATDAFDKQIARLVALGETSLGQGDRVAAGQLAERALELDPAHVGAKALAGAVERRALGAKLVARVQPGEDGESLLKQLPKEPDALEGQPPKEVQDLIKQADTARRINTERMELEVNRAVENARGTRDSDIDLAIENLKEVQGTVLASTDLIADRRERMLRILRAEIQGQTNRRERAELEMIKQQERLARIEGEKRLLEQMALEEQRLEQLLDQVRALMQEGYHGKDEAFEEAEEVAERAVDLRPGNGPAEAARFTAEAAGHLNKAFRLRALRDDRFLETLYQVELSHVPFPDEPPIRWPAAEVWKALTERRKKWSSIDLHKNSPNEDRIRAALDETTEVDFTQLPLRDVIQFIAELHDITIILDEAALAEEGIAPEEPITRQLSGISLRSALKIILEPLNLTYIIKDEVLQITTEVKANDYLTTRVYPVGDLVIPIVSAQPGGLGGGLGGAGGVGGFGGGGFGGGGFGGGGFGGGGGLFSVPSGPVPKAKKPAAPLPGVAVPFKPAAAKPAPNADVEKVLDKILDEKQGRLERPGRGAGQAMAQVRDDVPGRPFRLDNAAIEALKKKPVSR